MKIISPEIATNYKTTFLSCEKDQELIWKKLLFESKPYSDKLKRLLIINTPDCLDLSQYQYQKEIDDISMKDLWDKDYIRVIPKFELGEHEEVKSYIILEFDDFLSTTNPCYRTCIITLTVMCHTDYWKLDDYKLRPHQIAGYIDGILNETKLSGLGTLQFLGAAQVMLNEDLGGIVLRYESLHGNGDDTENRNPEWPAPQNL